MALYPGFIPLEGYEGFLAYALDGTGSTGMLAPDTAALGTSPTLALAGYAVNPDFARAENINPVYAGGSAVPLVFPPGIKETGVQGSIVLGGGTATKTFLKAASRESLTGAIPAINRHMCLGVVAIGGGAVGVCQVSRSLLYVLRYGLFNSLTLNIQVGQPVVATYDIWGLAIDDSQTALTTTEVNATAVTTAGGSVFTFANSVLSLAPPSGTVYDYSTGISGVSLTLNNSLRRVGQRTLANAGSTTASLFRAPAQINVGRQFVTGELTWETPPPVALIRGDCKLGDLTVTLSDGTQTIAIAATGLYQNGQMRRGGGDGPQSVSMPILGTSMNFT